MNVDTLRTNDAISSLITNISRSNIDIYHAFRKHTIIKRANTKRWIYYSAEIQNENNNGNASVKAGISIAIKTGGLSNIIYINRISSGIMEVRLKTGKYTKHSNFKYIRT